MLFYNLYTCLVTQRTCQIWIDYIFHVSAGGNIETLADMHLEKQAADIGYDPVKRIVFVPTLKAKTVIAYRLN